MNVDKFKRVSVRKRGNRANIEWDLVTDLHTNHPAVIAIRLGVTTPSVIAARNKRAPASSPDGRKKTIKQIVAKANATIAVLQALIAEISAT